MLKLITFRVLPIKFVLTKDQTELSLRNTMNWVKRKGERRGLRRVLLLFGWGLYLRTEGIYSGILIKYRKQISGMWSQLRSLKEEKINLQVNVGETLETHLTLTRDTESTTPKRGTTVVSPRLVLEG